MTAVAASWWAGWRDLPRIVQVAVALVVVQIVLALLAPLLAPWDPLHQDILARFSGPTWDHPLGADRFGRDVLSRVLYGYRASFAVAFVSVAASLLVGGTLGLLAAYYGGWTDRIVSRCMDVLFAFPIILLAIGIIRHSGYRHGVDHHRHRRGLYTDLRPRGPGPGPGGAGGGICHRNSVGGGR